MIQMIGDRILVEPDPVETKTKGGIVIPDNAQPQQVFGTVLSVGTGHLLQNGMAVPLTIKVGDHVLFGKFGGTDVTIEGRFMKIFHESEILGVEHGD